MARRFRALRTVAVVFKAFAWVALIGGALVAIGVLIAGLTGSAFLYDVPGTAVVGSILTAIVGAVLLLLGAFIYFVMLYAAGEAIELGLAIEENTRETSYYLRSQSPTTPQVPMR